MNITEYLLRRQDLEKQNPKYRILCMRCIQPDFSCYCKAIQPIDCSINFVVLIHPIEAKRRIATGRMAHLCLQGSHLIQGQDYSESEQVNQLIADEHHHSVLLYPGKQSTNLSELSKADRNSLIPKDKKLRIFVVDGTWATARRTVRQSQNLKDLPRISFNPAKSSNFRVRKQPAAHCFSTIEAIHHTLELIDRPYDHLLDVFNSMVERQLTFMSEASLNLRRVSYRNRAI